MKENGWCWDSHVVGGRYPRVLCFLIVSSSARDAYINQMHTLTNAYINLFFIYKWLTYIVACYILSTVELRWCLLKMISLEWGNMSWINNGALTHSIFTVKSLFSQCSKWWNCEWTWCVNAAPGRIRVAPQLHDLTWGLSCFLVSFISGTRRMTPSHLPSQFPGIPLADSGPPPLVPSPLPGWFPPPPPPLSPPPVIQGAQAGMSAGGWVPPPLPTPPPALPRLFTQWRRHPWKTPSSLLQAKPPCPLYPVSSRLFFSGKWRWSSQP